MLPPKALVLSPFATFPPDAGQRKRAYQTTRLLKELGYRITFVLYAFEDGWKASANEPWIEQMRQDWDELIVWRANPKVGMPPESGLVHGIDEWWDDDLEMRLKQIFGYRFYDVFVVHNVWLSKAFDFVPRGTVRILDSHDVFSSRQSYFERLRGAAEFFLPDETGEAYGVSRADIVLAIQEKDEDWFRRRADAMPLCLPYDPGDAERYGHTREDFLHRDKVVFGFLGSAHVFNVRGLAAYCDELNAIVGRTAAPVELRIGGAVSATVRARGPWVLCGKVADEDQFLLGVDIAVVPVFDGSGFKIKVADAAARGLPVLASHHAAIGMNLDRRVLARTPRELAQLTVDIALRRPPYRELRAIADEAKLDLRARSSRGALKLDRKIRNWRRAVAYDLSGLADNEARAVLLSWSGAFQVMRSLAKQFVVVPERVRGALQDLLPTGVFLVGEQEMSRRSREVWRWITVKNINPAKWGAKPADIAVDEAWRQLIDDKVGQCDGRPLTPEPAAQFWHNIAWDELVKKLICDAGTGTHEIPSAAPQDVYVASRDRGRRLGGPLGRLFSDHGVADVDTFGDFVELLFRAAAGNLRRLVVTDTLRPDRIEVLRQLCGIRGLEYVGPAEGGGLSLGVIPERIVREHYLRFERQWRLDPAARRSADAAARQTDRAA